MIFTPFFFRNSLRHRLPSNKSKKESRVGSRVRAQATRPISILSGGKFTDKSQPISPVSDREGALICIISTRAGSFWNPCYLHTFMTGCLFPERIKYGREPLDFLNQSTSTVPNASLAQSVLFLVLIHRNNIQKKMWTIRHLVSPVLHPL